MKDIRGLATREREFYRREDARRKAKAKADSPLEWRRDGDDWVLLAGRRRLGRVVPDPKYSRMWSSVKSGGQLSDMANLSWAKNAVLIAAEHELEWEARERPAIDPSKCPEKGCFWRGFATGAFFPRGGRMIPPEQTRILGLL